MFKKRVSGVKVSVLTPIKPDISMSDELKKRLEEGNLIVAEGVTVPISGTVFARRENQEWSFFTTS